MGMEAGQLPASIPYRYILRIPSRARYRAVALRKVVARKKRRQRPVAAPPVDIDATLKLEATTYSPPGQSVPSRGAAAHCATRSPTSEDTRLSVPSSAS